MWYSWLIMKRGRRGARVALLAAAFSCAAPGIVTATGILPSVVLVVAGPPELNQIESVVLARISQQARYRPAVTDARDASVFDDGAFRIDLSGERSNGVWSLTAAVTGPDGTSASRSARIPDNVTLLTRADAFAQSVVAALEEIAGPAGTVRITNTGSPRPYLAYADDVYLGSDVTEIRLPPGEYLIRITRRTERFETEIGRREIEVVPDDLVEVMFSLEAEAPALSGFERLNEPEARWRAVLDLRGGGFVQLSSLSGVESRPWWGGSASAMFADVGRRGMLMYAEGSSYLLDSVVVADRSAIGITLSSVVAGFGLIAGPVAGVDFTARTGVGLTHIDIDGGANSVSTTVLDGVDDLAAAVAQFAVQMGFGVGRSGRISVQYGTLVIVDTADPAVFVEVGLGFGRRF